MAAAARSIAGLLCHAPPMVLLDELVDSDAEGVVAAVTVRADDPFFVAGEGIAAHVGLEWMAQACGVFAGVEAQAAGQPVRLGFLLGTRRFQASRSHFAEGERALVSVRLVFRENGMAVFDGRISVGGAQVADAQLTLYQPEDGAVPGTAGASGDSKA